MLVGFVHGDRPELRNHLLLMHAGKIKGSDLAYRVRRGQQLEAPKAVDKTEVHGGERSPVVVIRFASFRETSESETTQARTTTSRRRRYVNM